MHSAFARRSLATAMAVLAPLVAETRADIELQSVPPPQPAAVQAQTYLGESVDIKLTGFTRSSSALQFRIRRPPSYGTLSDIRMTSATTAVVTYTHDPRYGTGVDQFRYAVGAPGVGYSTPAEVTISIGEHAPIFVAPSRLAFPSTPVGRAAFDTIELRNDGGGVIEGKLTVPAPWVIVDGDGSYSLKAGVSQLITLSFAPAEAQSYSAEARFSHAPDVGIVLEGVGFAPVEVVPREIRLEADGRNEARTGNFLLRNVSDEDFDLRIEAPPEVVVQDAVHSPAHSEQQVVLHTKAGFLGGIQGTVRITGGGVVLNVPLQVLPAPERLVVEPATADFGTLDTGRQGRVSFTVRNVGGSPADLSVRMPAGLSLSPDPTSEKIDPGASREFQMRFSRPLPGEYSEKLVIEAGESTAEIAFTAKVRQQWQKGGSQKSSRPEMTYSDLPPVMQIGVARQTRTELDLVWKKNSPDITGYILYMRTVIFDAKGKPSFRYEKLDRVKPRLVRDEVRVTLAGLRPGESVTLLVVGVDKNGLMTRPSPPLTVATLPKPVFRIPWLGVCIFALAVIIVLIVRERRRSRASSDAEFQARMEEMNR